MQHKIGLVSLVVLLVSLLLISCGPAATPTPQITVTPKAPVTLTPKVGPPIPAEAKFTIAAAGAGTGITIRLAAIAEAIKKTAPGWDVTMVTGTTESNVKRLDSNEIQVSFLNTPTSIIITEGGPPYNKVIPVKVITKNALSHVYAFVRAKTGLTSMRDMISKRYPLKVNVGRKNSDPELSVRMMLQAYGVTYEDIESWRGKLYYLMASTEGMDLMQQGMIEAQFFCGTWSAEAVAELNKMDITAFRLDEDVLKKLEAQGMTRVITRGGERFTFIKEDLPTVAMTEMLISRPDLPDDVAYTIIKAIWENRNYLLAAHVEFKDMLKPEFLASPPKVISWHPGAEQYYRDMGWLK